ncbi:hypothetical protein D3C80_1721800 [compost metagenome]
MLLVNCWNVFYFSRLGVIGEDLITEILKDARDHAHKANIITEKCLFDEMLPVAV